MELKQVSVCFVALSSSRKVKEFVNVIQLMKRHFTEFIP
jgi:hypothetical protein